MAIALDISALILFRRRRTTILPNRGAGALVTEGPFSKSRNPIYLGNTMLTFGLGLLFATPWLLLAAPLAAFVTARLAIAREETHLAAKFPREWQRYAANTPRWIWKI